MSMGLGWDQTERPNGSILCEKYIVHGKCSREFCKWKHTAPKPGEARPPCGNLKLKGGCAMGKHCKLSHEQLDATDIAGVTHNKINGLPFGLTKEAQTNGRPIIRPYPEPNPGMGQPSGSGVSLGIGNDNRTNFHTNYKPPIQMSAARHDWKQRKDAAIGKPRHEGPKPRSVTEAPSFNLRDGGVALGASPSNSYDGSTQVRKVLDDHSTQYGHSTRPTPIIERTDKTLGRSHKIDNLPHGSVLSHRKDFPSQNWYGNMQQIRPQFSAHRPVRDQTSMNRGSGPDLISRTGSIGARNETVRDSSNVQTRVILHDPKFPTMTERQGEARLSLSAVHKAKLSNEMSTSTSHINTKAPQGHEGKRRQTQGLSHASPLPGDPGGGSGKQILGSEVGNGSTRTGLIQDLSQGTRSELRGGGVALNNHPRTTHTPENKIGPVLIGTSDTPTIATTGDAKVETNGNGHNSTKSHGYGSQSPSTLSTLKSPKGTGDGEEIQFQLVSALRKIGRMDPRARSWSPENTRRASTGGSLAGGIRVGHSNQGGFVEVPAMDGTGLAIGRPIENGGKIPESLGSLPAVGQQRSTVRPTETAPWNPKSPGFNEVENLEGGARLGSVERGEYEEGGAKLQNVELKLYSSQINVGLGKGNYQPIANGISNPLQGIAPPRGSKHLNGLYNPGQNYHHSPHWAQEGHDWKNSATQSRGGHCSSTQGTVYSGPRYRSQFGPEIERNRHIAQYYQPSGYEHGVIAVTNNMIPASQFDNHNTPLNTSFMSNPMQVQFREPQRESMFLNDRSTRFPQAPSSRPASDFSSLYRRQSLNETPPTMFSFESPLDSQGIQDDIGQSRGRYTPEPEELDRSALKLYYDEMMVKEIPSYPSQDVWEEPAPPNKQESPVDYSEFIKGDPEDKDVALPTELENSEKLLRMDSTISKQPLGGAPSLPQECPKKSPVLEQSFEKTPSSWGEPSKKKLPSVPEQTSEKTTPSWEERPRGPPPTGDKYFGKKNPSAWERPLVKATSPKPSQDTCWMCGRHHQRDENEECGAGRKAAETEKSKNGWASTIDSHNDWDWRNESSGHANGWFDGEMAGPEINKRSPTKEKQISKEPQTAKEPQNRDKNGVGHVNRQLEKEAVELAKWNKKRKKEHTQKKSSSNGRLEKVEAVPEGSVEAPRSDGQKSVMFKADGNHFGQYYEDNLGGIRILSEDTLHMIFSYVADGLMPEDQMKMKNVHIGSNFRLDASFTTTRYRRLKSVLRSCRYWRHLSQHIVYKYINLDQFCNFKGFVRTISEDAELGKMVRAVKLNIQGGASYMSHDNRLSKQELSEMPKSSDSALLFTAMMESCPELQILSANMYGAIRGFNFVLAKFPKMREMQIMDDSSKGMVAHNLWENLGNYPNLEKFRIFHSEENGGTNFDTLKLLPPRGFLSKRSTTFLLKALTMERAPELSDKIIGVFASRLKQLTNLVIVDCKLVTSAGLARAIQKMPNPNQLNRLIYYVWVDPFGKATPEEMAPSKDHLCSTIRDYCNNLTYINWKPYRICGDFWKGSGFRSLKRCRIEPMVFRDCGKDIELRNHSKFMDAYRQAREEERLPELAEDRVVFDFYF